MLLTTSQSTYESASSNQTINTSNAVLLALTCCLANMYHVATAYSAFVNMFAVTYGHLKVKRWLRND
eukprot:scaffold647800_cov32-Prasinocladus_malaysianus.AAC.2